jgi:D-amino-acid oxidase
MEVMSYAVVIGAGVSGLTTAICLAERGCEVQVWTRDEPRRTTSMVAGALWGPSFQQPIDSTLRWCEVSLREFRALADVAGSGVRMVPALTVGAGTDVDGPLPPQVRLIPDLRSCPPQDVPSGWSGGARSTLPLIDMGPYLDHLVARLAAAGGTFSTVTLRTLAEAADAAPIVANCAGLGARELAGDPTVRPVRGQHVVLTNPGITELFMELAGPEWTSIFPHPTRVICGGNSVPDSWDTAVDEALTDRIVARCQRVEPRLRDADIVDVVVGLRPERPAIRVEAQRLGSALLVHNYGHGGEGVSLSWGCAREAADLALNGNDERL